MNLACIGTSHRFSTTTSPTSIDQVSSSSSDKTTKNDDKDKTKKKNDDPNWFLDNIGKIFLAIVASIIASLVRSSYNTSNKNAVRDYIEEYIAALDPCEIEDLRIANSELTLDVYRRIMMELFSSSNTNELSYEEFVQATRTIMANMKGEMFTIQLGHCIDRVVISIMKKYRDQKEKERGDAIDGTAGSDANDMITSFDDSNDDKFPIMLWMTILALAVNSPVPDRIKILYELLELNGKNKNVDTPTIADVIELVGYLQDSNQLPPDTQVIPTDEKYPTQKFRCANPNELVPWEGLQSDSVDLDAFASILRSKSVCAWGECYQKKHG